VHGLPKEGGKCKIPLSHLEKKVKKREDDRAPKKGGKKSLLEVKKKGNPAPKE